jgi:hypothetical protein
MVATFLGAIDYPGTIATTPPHHNGHSHKPGTAAPLPRNRFGIIFHI